MNYCAASRHWRWQVKNLYERIEKLEAKAGVGDELPTIVVIFGIGSGDEALKHASIDCKEGRIELHRRNNEGLQDFQQRVHQFAKEERRVAWMYP